MSEIKISELSELSPSLVDDTDILVLVHNGTTYNILIGDLKPLLVDYYTLTSASFDSTSDTQIPVSSEIHSHLTTELSSSVDGGIVTAEINTQISGSIKTLGIITLKINQLINATTASIYISSSQEIDNDTYKSIYATTGTGSLVLNLSGIDNGHMINISKIDSGSGYVRISSSYNETILDESYFDLYYQHEVISLEYNSGSSNYVLAN